MVSGTTMKGVIKLNDTLLLGPDPFGHFTPIAVRSIHRKRMPVGEVRGGQTASFALKKTKRSQIRKGMVMVSPALNPQACWEFEGEILVLHHPTTISFGYEAMGKALLFKKIKVNFKIFNDVQCCKLFSVHCGSIRQTATIRSMSQECLRTGDKAQVRFSFFKFPEYIKPGQRIVFREGRTKAVGKVSRVFPQSTPITHKMMKKSKKERQVGATSTSQEPMATNSAEGQAAKRKNISQKSGMSPAIKKSGARRGTRGRSTTSNLAQPLSEQNPPA